MSLSRASISSRGGARRLLDAGLRGLATPAARSALYVPPPAGEDKPIAPWPQEEMYATLDNEPDQP